MSSYHHSEVGDLQTIVFDDCSSCSPALQSALAPGVSSVSLFSECSTRSYPSSPAFKVCQGDLNCVIPGLYAMVGAAATLSDVTVRDVSRICGCIPISHPHQRTTVWL